MRTIFYLCFRFSVSEAAITRSIVADDAIDVTNVFYMRFTLKPCSFVVVGGAYAACICIYICMLGCEVVGVRDNGNDQCIYIYIIHYTESAPECVHCSLEVCDI